MPRLSPGSIRSNLQMAVKKGANEFNHVDNIDHVDIMMLPIFVRTLLLGQDEKPFSNSMLNRKMVFRVMKSQSMTDKASFTLYYMIILTSAQRVPEPDPLPGIFFYTRPDPIQF